MDILKQKASQDLQKAREQLAYIKKPNLTGSLMFSWYYQWKPVFLRLQSITGDMPHSVLGIKMQGYENETDVDVLDDLRSRIVSYLDGVMVNLDSKQTVRPVLEDLISKVKDTKLATLLNEFNRAKDTHPNLSAIGFRTIVTLIIQERAKIANPTSPLATKDDLGFEPDIKVAIKEGIFESAEEKLLHRHLTGGKKDTFDNVAHKPGVNTLVNKDDLEDAVGLLNRLLPTIIQ
jgi:hypothetical protein